MRYIKPENALVFLPLGTAAGFWNGSRLILKTESSISQYIKDLRDSYMLLLEVKHGICDLSETIISADNDDLFKIIKGKYYDDFMTAMDFELVWDTETNSVNFKESVRRWRSILSSGMVRKVAVDRIRSNDLNNAIFGNFGADLLLYLLHCPLDGDCYTPTQEVIKISMMDVDSDLAQN